VISRWLRSNFQSRVISQLIIYHNLFFSLATMAPRKRRAVIAVDSSDGEEDSGIDNRSDELLRVGEAEGSEDEPMFSSPAKKPKPRRAAAIKSIDDFIVESEESLSEESTKPSKKNPQYQKAHSSKKPAYIELSDDSEIDLGDQPIKSENSTHKVSTPKKRKRENVSQEEKELAEDLQFLRSSSPLRENSSSKSTARQQALEQLRNSRAKTRPSKPSRRRVIDSDSSVEDEDNDTDVSRDDDSVGPDENEGSDGELDENQRADSIDAAAVFDDEDEEDRNFIVEDDEDDPIGVPVDMPLQFSGLNRAKGKDLFKYAIEWMVQKKINPAFAINDEVYDLAFKKLNDEVQGLAGSKFTSSAWIESFTTALKARPDIKISDNLDTFLSDHCEACNRTNHPAKFNIQFEGKPYDPITLDEVEASEDSDDDDDINETYDSAGRLVPPESKIFHVGR
jgi:hypothetical protein